MLNGHLTNAYRWDEYLTKANTNLHQLFGDKHTPITLLDLDAIYKRSDLLSINADAKTSKGLNSGYLTGILYLAPSTISGFNVCPGATQGCKAACLFSAGRGRFYSVYRARTIKTLAFLSNPDAFLEALKHSITKLEAKAKALGLQPVVRLNGTSDIDWTKFNLKDSLEFINIFTYFSNIQFYDYTKIGSRLISHQYDHKNYHLTFSASEFNQNMVDQLSSMGYNVAVVFKERPSYYLGKQVINGDETDLRFLDPKA